MKGQSDYLGVKRRFWKVGGVPVVASLVWRGTAKDFEDEA